MTIVNYKQHINRWLSGSSLPNNLRCSLGIVFMVTPPLSLVAKNTVVGASQCRWVIVSWFLPGCDVTHDMPWV